jgi:methionine synthase II (cobalamin-independent)
MTDYDPRTATGIPTEPVGSLPRPSWLQRAYAQYDAGEITRDQLAAEQDKAESPEEVRDALVRAANFIPADQLASTDDCGFSPFSIDEKPNHGSPDFARDTAWQKVTNRVEGTKLAAEKLGIS